MGIQSGHGCADTFKQRDKQQGFGSDGVRLVAATAGNALQQRAPFAAEVLTALAGTLQLLRAQQLGEQLTTGGIQSGQLAEIYFADTLALAGRNLGDQFAQFAVMLESPVTGYT
ncbi:hypothetical protein NBRC116187_14010 [Halopseudomonas sabulinigri]|uniref:Uncharacterized protein n=1 Tax=Halopseudomonas sabulinigri TaxID=472181 RepID=A0ABP9ZNL3_9GAMM